MILIINIIILELATEGWWNILKNALTGVTLHVGNQHNKTKRADRSTYNEAVPYPLLESAGKIHHRDIWNRNTECHTSQLSIHAVQE